MKITHLLEGSVAGDPGITQNSQQAPRFGRDPTTLEQVANVPNIGFKSGRDPKVLEKQVDETTTSGAIASVPQSMGKTIKRGSIFSGIKTSSKYPNSKKAGIYEDEISEEQLQARKKKQEFFNRAMDRGIGTRAIINNIIAKKVIDEIFAIEEDTSDDNFWYEGADSIAKQLFKVTNGKQQITTDDITELWNKNPPSSVNIINNKPYMDKPDVASILKSYKELMNNGQMLDEIGNLI